MKTGVARFQVSSRIAHLLSQEYSSSEKALKELIDNAWDADAESVRVTLPRPMTDDTIEIVDDGTGMTEEELRRHYLDIAADRRARRGERSANKNRKVKGRKGIGKFAGLMTATEMRLETSARGVTSSFALRLADLASVEDIETLSIEIITRPCAPDHHGTRIILSELHSGFSLPDPKKFRQVLLQEYGRETDFRIYVDGKALGIDDVDGKYKELKIGVDGVGDVYIRFAITEANIMSRQAGLTLRVEGKAIGKPGFFGLDTKDDFPQKLLKKLYGEIDADGLREHVTAGWDTVVENSELLAAVVASVQPILIDAFKERYQRDLRLANARLKRVVHERLSRLPEFRREYAEKAIRKILDRFFGEPAEKIEPFVYVLLEAIEDADYGAVLHHLADCDRSDVSTLADALADFGLAEMAYLVDQAKARQDFLDRLEDLGQNKKTLEIEMHKAIEKSLWILGPQYTLFSSNKTLARQTNNYLTEKFAKARSKTRPDLLLNEDLYGRALLIEFKRPSHALNHEDYRQAITYRHDLLRFLNKEIEVLVIGGSRSADFPISHLEPDVRAVTYDDVIASARRQLQWQLRCDD